MQSPNFRAPYKLGLGFNSSTLRISDKYREGRLVALKYIGELCFHYLLEEKSIKHKFQDQILKQMQQYSCLNDSDYKDGLYDCLNDMLDEISDSL